MGKKGNSSIVQFGSIVFTSVSIQFVNPRTRKGIVSVSGVCSGREMSPIKVSMILERQHRCCSHCGKEIFWFLPEATIDIINYLPASNELVVRVEVTCECGTAKMFPVLLPLEKE